MGETVSFNFGSTILLFPGQNGHSTIVEPPLLGLLGMVPYVSCGFDHAVCCWDEDATVDFSVVQPVVAKQLPPGSALSLKRYDHCATLCMRGIKACNIWKWFDELWQWSHCFIAQFYDLLVRVYHVINGHRYGETFRWSFGTETTWPA